MAKFTDMTALELSRYYATGDVSPVEVMEAVLAHAEATNPIINALAFVQPEESMERARASEDRWRNGASLSPIDGVPITLKDSIAESSRPMWRGIRANMHLPPLGYDSPVAKSIKEAGGNIFAKTTVPDFCGTGSGVSTAYGLTRNPWNLEYNTGGSSAGSGAAVAAGLGPLTVGSDIGGSVRVPAAHNGLVALKPTQGRIPHLPASTTRSAGPMTRTVADNALLLSVISKPDRRDIYSLPAEPNDYVERLQDFRFDGKKIMLVLEQEDGVVVQPEIEQAVRRAAGIFESLGAKVEQRPSLTDQVFMDAVYTVMQQRGYAEYKKVAHIPGGTFDFFADWYSGADDTTGADVAIAQDIIDKTKAEIADRFEEFDYIISPTASISGFPAESFTANADGSQKQSYFTPLWNQTGHPALSICCGFDPANGMPLSLQIAGHRFDDLGVLQLAYAFELARGFEMAWPY